MCDSSIVNCTKQNSRHLIKKGNDLMGIFLSASHEVAILNGIS